MGTRGFVGYKFGNEIKGWYNHFDSYYGGLGKDVYTKYIDHNRQELTKFFLEHLQLTTDDNHYSNHKDIFEASWVDPETRHYYLQDGSDFLNDGLFCEYGYVFDLQNDSVDVYRGFFKEPQYEGHKGFKNQYWTHKVFTLRRDNLYKAGLILRGGAHDIIGEDEEWETFLDEHPYWEQKFLEMEIQSET